MRQIQFILFNTVYSLIQFILFNTVYYKHPHLSSTFVPFCRSRLKPHKLLNRVEVVEIDAKSKDVKKVRFVDRKEVVESNVKVS